MSFLHHIGLALLLVLPSASQLVSAAEGTCPAVKIAPRTLTAPASQYAASGKFGLDNDGILVFDYGAAYGGLGKFRNPYFISNYANALYRDYLRTGCRDENLRHRFLLQANYLKASAVRKGDMALWTYPFRNDVFDLPADWISGIGQARIAGVLMRAYALTGDISYRRIADAGMAVYGHTLVEGGVITRKGNTIWIEEAPSPDGRSYKVLNGHITALSGLIDYFELSGDARWHKLYEAGVEAVRQSLPEFDAGFTSYYSLSQPGHNRILAPKGDYNALHVEQLLWLFDQTRDAYFLKWASRFQAYETNNLEFSAKGSVDARGHGPSQAAGLYGSHYWSHAEFPTWLQVLLPKKERVRGFWIDGNGQKASPKDFLLSAFVNGKWRQLNAVRGNTGTRVTFYWRMPVLTDRFRLDILSDNGNRNVAIQAAVPIIAESQYAAITNACNYKIGKQAMHNITSAVDDNLDDDMSVYCPGWIVLPNTDRKERLSIQATGSSNAKLRISASPSMSNWRPVAIIDADHTGPIPVPPSKFIKIEFGSDITKIRLVRLN